MAQGAYQMEDITSAKFRIFLAEKAVNYLFTAGAVANVLLTNTNIGCPNISFGGGTPVFHALPFCYPQPPALPLQCPSNPILKAPPSKVYWT